ncbi:MAG: cytochrome c biogenesis protein DipZ [bacterium]|nr:cytochrome c biogenesis protein DipZ [bacterium]
MALLLIFAFASGFVTALTPCVLPILPIVLSSTVTGGKRRPLGVIVGLIVSFTFFTLALTALVDRFNFPPDLIRNIAIVLIFIFGLSMIVPFFAQMSEKLFSLVSGRLGSGNAGARSGFGGGVLIGLTVGLLWVPCAGPILAAVITLAATQAVTFQAVLITFSYICGSSIVLLLIAYGGKGILGRFRSINKYSSRIQQIFGVIMILTSLALVFDVDRKFQIFIVQRLPSWALTPLGSLESSNQIVGQLQKLRGEESKKFDSATLLTNNGPAPEFVKPTQWLNTEKPLTMSELKGKVVLVDFWTYSCVNCIRTFPYVESWQKKYGSSGFTVIGVHSPEFAFEKVQSNVEKAIKDFGLTYPVVMDNDFGTWKAYSNRYWPAHYLVDAQGIIRRVHFGEGDYENMERAIQALLAERGVQAEFDLTKESAAPIDRDLSPETYLGYSRMSPAQFVSKERVVTDTFSNYSVESAPALHKFGLSGSWKITPEYGEAKRGSTLKYHFIGKEINLVMSDGGNSVPTGQASSVRLAEADVVCTDAYCQGNGTTKVVQIGGKRVKVTISGTLAKNLSVDVLDGIISVRDAKLYNLATFADVTDATVELEFMDDGVQVFAFTFG